MAPSLQSILSTPSSPMGRVEKATSSLLMGPNWMMNMDISNSINTNPWKAKAFVKAVKKRLRNKNSKVQFLALTLLETMIKNCGDLVHFQVVDLGILQEMVRIVRKTRSMQVREKILLLLESWQEAFGGPNGKYPQFYYTYADLKRSGVRFPQNQTKDDLPTTNQPQVGYGMPSNSVERLDEVMASESFSDLANIRSVMDLFSNMLQAVNPEDHGEIKDEVIIDLANQCLINQKRLMQLINSTKNDDLLREALTINDNLQILISKHDALTRSSVPAPPLAPEMSEESDDEEEDGFSNLANRNSVTKSTGDQEVSPNKNGINSAVSVTSATEGSSSILSNALIVFDPPAPADSSKNEGDMNDLLSLILSKNQSPQTDPAMPPPSLPQPSQSQSNQNQNPFSNSPIGDGYYNYPQPLMPNEGYTTYNSYITPWAQPDVVQLPERSPDFLQQLPRYATDYLANSWISPEASLNPFILATSTQTQYPESQSSVALGSSASAVTAHDSKALQDIYSFGSKENQLNSNVNLVQPSSAPKTYMPDNLFDDLIKLRNSDGSLKSRNVSSLWGFSGQGMASVN